MTIAKRFEDLVAWQLSAELRERLVRLTDAGRVSQDFKFCGQIRDAAASAARNLAEGFGRFDPGDFAKFASYARASLDETRNHVNDAATRGYFGDADTAALLLLIKRASVATTRLIRYLRSEEAKKHARRIRQNLENAKPPKPRTQRT